MQFLLNFLRPILRASLPLLTLAIFSQAGLSLAADNDVESGSQPSHVSKMTAMRAAETAIGGTANDADYDAAVNAWVVTVTQDHSEVKVYVDGGNGKVLSMPPHSGKENEPPQSD